MEQDISVIAIRLAVALGAGSLIGLERTYHGRAAGFRTHALVCVASCLLMFLAAFFQDIVPDVDGVFTIDPTRMAQGIMMGIGFLGAGAIMKEGLSIRGLTTAASIWMTAAIGIIIGMGMLEAAGIAEFITLGILALFGWVESKVPSFKYAKLSLEFQPSASITQAEIHKVIDEHRMTFHSLSYQFDTHAFRYEMTIRTRIPDNFRKLAEDLRQMEQIVSFRLEPAGD